MPKFNIDEVENTTLMGLKDFQRATVERIDYLYRNNQNRVLVADEVGLGKTLIARGVIVKTARLRIKEKNDLLKVVYICSNQNIANQNIRKLDITNGHAIESVSDTRLSMQHLKIAQQECSMKANEGFIQLTPLTPETSFRMTNGRGCVNERALMFAILRRMEEFRNNIECLEEFMMYGAASSWNTGTKSKYEKKVSECEKQSKKRYPTNIIQKIREYPEFDEIKERLLDHLYECRYNEKLSYSNPRIMYRLRVMFARISVSMMEPDLVIMDEFQRFKFLLSSNDSEMEILAHSFLSGSSTRILLLSATPYKLYSTMEEIDESNLDEHYAEFYQVMDFLFDEKKSDFHTVWKDYSIALAELTEGDTSIIQVKKQAQSAMYQGVCRTERISVMDSGDYTDDSSVKEHLSVSENDILSYVQMGKLLEDTNSKYRLPVDYVKSCPYLMSFMRKYKLKESLNKFFKEHPALINLAKGNMLWINERKINRYEELPKTNARLSELIKKSIGKSGELYLWVPPSKPYYELRGVYRNSSGFSKMLVFSSWEMVPRMIGSLVSYESERKTIGRLSRQTKNQDKKNANYFSDASKRYPGSRLRFNVSKGEVKSLSLFCLLYPSKSLSGLYEPISSMNQGMTLEQIEREIRKTLTQFLDKLEDTSGLQNKNRVDDRWYYLAPMLLDGFTYVNKWISDITALVTSDDEIFMEKGNKGFLAHIAKLREYLDDIENARLGKQPVDLIDTLVNMTLGSPAICIYRSNGNNEARATELAKVFINNFNLTEATAIVDLAYGRCHDDNSHWQNVVKYCKDGCFQAMFDEYYHLLSETVGMAKEEELPKLIHNMMMESLRIHTSTYVVDTYASFRKRANGEKGDGVRIRSSYAVGITKDAGDNEKQVNRKESVRNSFNSPMRPFVLATTSIGQEGLDFHNYCRKIMHWNLPSNPIDLEQREGRINRFKCLAIRQNVAEKYGSISFRSDIWKEMFEAAVEGERQVGQSELVPFWCFGKNQSVKIERIVPMYPISKDEVNYERLIKILSLYRLTLGQARQEELLDYLFKEFNDTEDLKELFMDLSPFSRKEGAK